MVQRGGKLEWDVVRQDLEALCEVDVRDGSEWYQLRTALPGVAGKVLRAVGVAVPPAITPLEGVVPKALRDPDSVAVSPTLL
ncbi:MAG: hypothetical protein HY680_08815 [Chloroflexi bacterium]|nr:hypothetical protein [Chloroflexota bacterium]